jgi:transketolase
MSTGSETNEIIFALRKRILEVSSVTKEGHVPSAFSILDILWVLYDRVLRISQHDVQSPDRDIFILSKGHAALGLFAVLAEKGFFPSSELDKFCSFEGILGGHPRRGKVPGVEASTGSLGHGLPIAVGQALAERIQHRDKQIFCLIGDGESNEGSVWEAAAIAAHHGLNNLCCIVDYNHSTDAALKMGNMAEKFSSFGWETREIDGHNHEEIYSALRSHVADRPLCIVARTVKGRGSPLMEELPAAWHHRSPTAAELPDMILALRKN